MAHETLRLVCLPVSTHDGRLPRQYTLEGQGTKKDISPPLEWYGVPGGMRSLALVVQDIDADKRVPWMHWVVANKSHEEKGLPEGFSGAGGNANAGGEGVLQEGVNDWKQPGWRGPAPDSHGHRIQFRLYALDDVLSLSNKANAQRTGAAQEAMSGIRRASKAMTKQEARKILGISEKTIWEEIVQEDWVLCRVFYKSRTTGGD
ncbi:UPF0098 protein CPn_0877/CP_0992/CPj0877/CpB0906-like [Hordeum vulgare subsp. vulgare]|uniref:UPF0098 protein CPn_0877/CP_0992/CPj0877/CpB0906-like n=1 Tax=Hordeum vulgare subsp. vulgare TaxID=112509 RepID=UPI001D1A3ABA|nr:UPF0098 protein CPn_0877/CP_0992/CPj0877/CpB0906-like [Hordeum vulgare subsp. vulgare]